MKKYIGAAMMFLANNWLFSMIALILLFVFFLWDIAAAAKDKGATL
jgi:hypothetical protein